MACTWFGEIGPCCCLPPLLNLPAAFSQPRANHKGLPSSSITRGLWLRRLAVVLAADAGVARSVDIGAILKGVAGAAGRVVGEPRAALGRL